MKEMKIFVLCTISTGLHAIDFINEQIGIKGIIGLTKRQRDDRISGYEYLEKYCKKKQIKFTSVEDYSLKNKSDKERLLSLDIDILLVLGWQRLIPSWLINHCKTCVIGAHGSSWGIKKGRGRSPQNWALILGKKEFKISIYKIDEGIDSGEIISSATFTLTDFDDIQTTYFKTTTLVSKMIVDKILNNTTTILQEKQEDEPRYLPQRLPEDGEIDWNRNTKNIYDFVRALTQPYPGAFSYFDNVKIKFWKVRSLDFDFNFDSNFESGRILSVFNDGKFLVKTFDGVLFIDDYSIETKGINFKIKEGMILKSSNFKDQIKNIIQRHYEKYPNYKINNEILKLAK